MSNRRSALGRGLGALISNPAAGARSEQPTQSDVTPEPAPDEESISAAREIRVDEIDPNPEQPRRHFDPDKLESMASSILRHGVLQPVVVRRAGERFELIMGERRWRASRAAGVETIPAVVADVATQDRLELAIVENVQRHDLNPIELAHAFRALAESGSTQEEIGRKVGLDRSSVANHMRLLELSKDIQGDLESGRISMGHAKALLQVSGDGERSRLRDQVVDKGLSVRATEQLGRRVAGPPNSPRSTTPAQPAELDADLQRLLDDLRLRFQAGVKLRRDGDRGRIEIEYSGAEDLRRITGILLGDR